MSDAPNRAEILAWLDESRRGYKAAAKRFGVPAETIREWRRGPDAPSKASAPAAPSAAAPPAGDLDAYPEPPERPQMTGRDLARWRARLSPLDHALDKLVQTEEALEAALESKGNAAGTAALLARARDARADVEAAMRSRPDVLAGATPEAFAAWLDVALADWPDQHLEAALLVYAARHKGRIRLLTEDHAAELSVDGWATVAS